jgi:hypothetical protein
MTEIDKDQNTIRAHLLGRLGNGELERLEEKFVTDQQFREVALVVEGELVDDYLAGSLSSLDRESFINHYLKHPHQRRELQLTAALRNYAIQSKATTTPALEVSSQPLRQKISYLLFGKRWVPVLVAIALLTTALFVAWNLAGKGFRPDQRAALNAELTLLNRRPANAAPYAVKLTPVLNRSPGQSQKVLVPKGADIVELQAHLLRQEHNSYQASLRVVDGESELFTVDGLPVEGTTDGQVVKLKVPSRLLTPADYVLSVRVLTADGRYEDVADYFFRVTT